MRLLQVADLYPPLIGGTERHVQALATELARRGHHSAVATLATPGSPALAVEPSGVRVHRIDSGWTAKIPGARSTGRPYHPPAVDPGVKAALREIMQSERPDVVYGHNWIIYSAVAAARGLGIPTVYVLHDYGAVCPARTMLRTNGSACSHEGDLADLLGCAVDAYGAVRGPLVAAGLAYAQRQLHPQITSFVAVSRHVAEVSTVGLSGRPCPVIPTFIGDTGEEFPSRPAFVPEGDYILFVGALGRFKGVDVLLNAYTRLENPPPLVMIGTRKPDTPSSWPTNVTVVEDVPHREVMAAWRHAAFGVVPSVWPEPWGQVAAEAVSVGTPVVASRCGGLTEIVDESNGLLVPPGDPHALFAAMSRMLSDPALRQSMRDARVPGSSPFSVSGVADDVEALVDSLRSSSVSSASVRHFDRGCS